MDDAMKFDYYYGIEAEQFSFYRVPRLLIKDVRFKGLSSDAKLLYGMMLDRMSLSMKNGWLDDEKIRALCGLDMPVRLLVTVGYPKEGDPLRKKVRKELSELSKEL